MQDENENKDLETGEEGGDEADVEEGDIEGGEDGEKEVE